jgi:hypothetical protein
MNIGKAEIRGAGEKLLQKFFSRPPLRVKGIKPPPFFQKIFNGILALPKVPGVLRSRISVNGFCNSQLVLFIGLIRLCSAF